MSDFSGLEGLRDKGLLESALARPRQAVAYASIQPDAAHIAAEICFGLTKNHAFLDGNKRTAFLTATTFLRRYYRLSLRAMPSLEDAEVADTMVAIAEGKLNVNEIAAWLRKVVKVRK